MTDQSLDKKTKAEIEENKEVEDIINLNESDPEKIYKVLEKSPEKMLKIISIAQSKLEYHSGPLPSPETLAKYKKIDEELFRAIVSMAKNQSNHRIEIEKQVISSDIKSEKRGQWFAFILFLILILGSFYLIYLGKYLGVAGVVSAIVGGIAIFINNKKTQRIEIDGKDKEMIENRPSKIDE